MALPAKGGLMKSRIKKLADECGLYLAEDNAEVLHREIEFLCEQVVRECVSIVDDAVARRVPASEYTGMIKQYFGIEYY
jgi:hypothetical protein